MWRLSNNTNFSEAARLDIAYNHLHPEYHLMIHRNDFTTFDELENLVLDFDWRDSRNPLKRPPDAHETIHPHRACVPSRYAKKGGKVVVEQINEVSGATGPQNPAKVNTDAKKSEQKSQSRRPSRHTAPAAAQAPAIQPPASPARSYSVATKAAKPKTNFLAAGRRSPAKTPQSGTPPATATSSKSAEFCINCQKNSHKRRNYFDWRDSRNPLKRPPDAHETIHPHRACVPSRYAKKGGKVVVEQINEVSGATGPQNPAKVNTDAKKSEQKSQSRRPSRHTAPAAAQAPAIQPPASPARSYSVATKAAKPKTNFSAAGRRSPAKTPQSGTPPATATSSKSAEFCINCQKNSHKRRNSIDHSAVLRALDALNAALERLNTLEEAVEIQILKGTHPVFDKMVPIVAHTQTRVEQAITELTAHMKEEKAQKAAHAPRLRSCPAAARYQPLPKLTAEKSSSKAKELAVRRKKSPHMWMEWGARSGCGNCSDPGHYASRCPYFRGSFCGKCGEEGMNNTNCPSCRPQLSNIVRPQGTRLARAKIRE
ncbi:uncharacterized protein LOC107040117 [Diachasma alloeum]|uniref:uncharacterized protein LOC107040117 n=1 Tax=Diachasma alloeum TaxID=454923 RepID=UPI0007382E90|nr:uncharacterized protein LOC107040117 [Diachasma alloeum]